MNFSLKINHKLLAPILASLLISSLTQNVCYGMISSAASQSSKRLIDLSKDSFTIPKPSADTIDNQWFEVPPWLAGTWCAFTQVEDTAKDKQHLPNKSVIHLRLSAWSSLGMAQDHRGHIWQFIGKPCDRIYTFGDCMEYESTKSIEVTKNTAQDVELTTSAYIDHVDLKSGASSWFLETTTVRYTRITADEMQTVAIVSDFNMKGKLIQSLRSQWRETKIAPFEPSALGDLQSLFDDFIKSKTP